METEPPKYLLDKYTPKIKEIGDCIKYVRNLECDKNYHINEMQYFKLGKNENERKILAQNILNEINTYKDKISTIIEEYFDEKYCSDDLTKLFGIIKRINTKYSCDDFTRIREDFQNNIRLFSWPISKEFFDILESNFVVKKSIESMDEFVTGGLYSSGISCWRLDRMTEKYFFITLFDKSFHSVNLKQQEPRKIKKSSIYYGDYSKITNYENIESNIFF